MHPSLVRETPAVTRVGLFQEMECACAIVSGLFDASDFVNGASCTVKTLDIRSFRSVVNFGMRSDTVAMCFN